MYKLVVLTLVCLCFVQAVYYPNPCSPYPCRNGGTCKKRGLYSYKCYCRKGYTGKNCQYNACFPNPCLNGGTCGYVYGYPYYKCSCPYGYYGTKCEFKRHYYDRCGGCLNGGLCISDSYGKYVCRCKPGYYGKRCIDPYY
uniref:PVFP-5 n=2 Tax=Perna viridis TaxID=73031 RepID=U5Y3S6_PERVI